MHTRALMAAETRLVELRHDEVEHLGLGALALGTSLVMTALYEPFVLPLFLGGLAMWLLGIRSMWRRWDLVDRLADDLDAYVIADVRAYAARDARMDRRRANATLIRDWTRRPEEADLAEVVDELEHLARDLEDVDLELSPASAIACRRLLTDPTVSPLLNGAPSDDLHETIVEIEAGFSAARRAD